MIHIALCDDETIQRGLTRRMLWDYAARRGVTARVWEFTDGLGLLRAAAARRFDLYLLDIVMPEMDGIQLGVSLRRLDREGAVVYLTTSPDFALDSFDARAFSYLLKPVEEEKLFPVLDELLALWKRRREESVLVKTAEGAVRLAMDSILYAELANRAPCYHLSNGACVAGITIHTSFRTAMEPLLADKRFHLCGSSFVFNLSRITAVSKSGAQFAGGYLAPAPRRSVGALQSAWADYWLEGGALHV